MVFEIQFSWEEVSPEAEQGSDIQESFIEEVFVAFNPVTMVDKK